MLGMILQALANDDPRKGSPSHGKRSNEHASGNDHDNARALVFRGWAGDGDRGEDQEPCRLPKSSSDQWNAATEPLNKVQARERRGDVDGAENKLDQECVVDTCRLEDGRSVL